MGLTHSSKNWLHSTLLIAFLDNTETQRGAGQTSAGAPVASVPMTNLTADSINYLKIFGYTGSGLKPTMAEISLSFP